MNIRTLRFTKMQSFGNDFVVLNGLDDDMRLNVPEVRHLADRNFGVGCDQVLVITRADMEGADYRMKVYNADGGISEQCGNGARCIVHFLLEQKLITGNICKLQVGTRLLTVYHLGGNAVAANMGEPEFEPKAVPFRAKSIQSSYDLEIDVEGAMRTVQIAVLSMGNPHAVLMVDDCETAEVETLGRAICIHRRFPKGANVGFMQVLSRDYMQLRVFERGVGETQSCGSGACAAVVIARCRQLIDEQVTVQMPGGLMNLEWSGPGEQVSLLGPVQTVYHGEQYSVFRLFPSSSKL